MGQTPTQPKGWHRNENLFMIKGEEKGFSVRESSENKKPDRCEPAQLETEFILGSNISFNFLCTFSPTSQLSFHGGPAAPASLVPFPPSLRTAGLTQGRRGPAQGTAWSSLRHFLQAFSCPHPLLLIPPSPHQECHLLQKLSLLPTLSWLN